MEVVKVRTEDDKERYFVADDDGLPIESILKFIRFKDNTNFARNTLRMYCQHLKLYFEYLEQRDLDFQKVTIDDLALFVNWLQNPYKSLKVIPTNKVDSARSPRTINIVVNTVLAFYDYILRHEEYSNNISERLKKFVSTPSRNFKGFLYGIAHEQKKVTSNILRLKVPKSKPKTLTKEEITILINTCNNFRDKFLLNLLYETGIRIGEALSLWIEDFDISNMIIDLKDRGELENNAEIKTVSSPRRIDIYQNLADMFMEYIAEYHTEEVETNHVFIKISGEITKTGIAQLKIPIRDKIAEMVQRSIDKAKELSTEVNNPNKYLFNIYEGKLRGTPINKRTFVDCIKRLIEQKDIRNANGELYHFKLHSLRHTRAKEYVEQGIGISIIQQILGHRSLQMTVHYATVSENILYEKWKDTEDLELFKVDTKTNDLEKIDLTSDTGENLIRYEYVKKNLDAVRVPFGVCFKPSKLPCKQQMNHCLTCASFCTTTENIPEYEEEI